MSHASRSFGEEFEYFCELIRYFHKLVGNPEEVKKHEYLVHRYSNQNLETAIFLKLVKRTNDLIAADLLRESGFFNVLASVERMIFEIDEDISFLFVAHFDKKSPKILEDFLRGFFEEEFDDHTDIISSMKRKKMIRREDIRKYLTKNDGDVSQISRNRKLLEGIYKIYSGFLHGSAPQIMELHRGNPSEFLVNGMLGTIRERENYFDFINYVYRGFQSFRMAALVFGDKELSDHLALVAEEYNKKYSLEK